MISTQKDLDEKVRKKDKKGKTISLWEPSPWNSVTVPAQSRSRIMCKRCKASK